MQQPPAPPSSPSKAGLPRYLLIGAAVVTVAVLCCAGLFLTGFLLRDKLPFWPTPTVWISSPGSAVALSSGRGQAFTAPTDVTGKVRLADPLTRQLVELQAGAPETGKPLAGIRMHYLSTGSEVLVIGVDPEQQRAPAVVRRTLSPAGQVTTITLNLRLLNSFQTSAGLMEYFGNTHRLDTWGWTPESACLSPAQLGDRLRTQPLGTAFVPLLSQGEELQHSAARPGQEVVLNAWAAFVVSGGQSGLADLAKSGAPLNVRFYRLLPLSVLMVEWIGTCQPALPPTPPPPARTAISPGLQATAIAPQR